MSFCAFGDKEAPVSILPRDLNEQTRFGLIGWWELKRANGDSRNDREKNNQDFILVLK